MHFRDIRHQERALSLIRRGLRSGRAPHAYLFDGPEGVGKELAARALCARLLCETEGRPLDACGECRACLLFGADHHPDFHLIHRGLHRLHPDRTIRSSKGLFLVVDLIRHFVLEPSARMPSLGRARIFLIRDAERMNEEAQNALLKTLEEPPGRVRLILLTSSASRLLPTIRSRCQRIRFDLLPRAFVEEHLEHSGVPRETARSLAAIVGGRLGVARFWNRIDLLEEMDGVREALRSTDDPETFAKRLVEIAEQIGERIERQRDLADASEDPADAGETAASTDVVRDAMKLVLLLAATHYRDALALAVGADRLRFLAEPAGNVPKIGADGDVDEICSAIRCFRQAEQMLDRNVAAQLACERLAIGLGGEK